MINYRVENLEALVEELKKEGVTITDTIETFDYGKFVHIMDIEGNKIELWEPNDIEYETRSIAGENKAFDNKTVVEIITMNVFDPARNCYWQPAGLAWGGCYRNKCYFHYSIPDTFKLVAYLPSKEKVFMTNEVESRWFNARYAADLKQDGTGAMREAMPFPPESREVLSIFLFSPRFN